MKEFFENLGRNLGWLLLIVLACVLVAVVAMLPLEIMGLLTTYFGYEFSEATWFVSLMVWWWILGGTIMTIDKMDKR
jgi:hypothetical protein